MFVPVRVLRTSGNSFLRPGLPVRFVVSTCQRAPSINFDSAKVRQVKRVQKNKSQLTNINYLSTDYQ